MPTPRTCVVDGSKYNYCPKCGYDNPAETWRKNFCSENCREIYNVSSSYVRKMLTANEAKKVLDNLDITKISTFRDSYQNVISEIMLNADASVIAESEIVEEIHDAVEAISEEYEAENDIATDVAVELSEEESVEENTDKKKKRRRFTY